MQTFNVLVTKAPFDSRNGESALRFCEAAISSGHVIKQVFFYQSGVHHANDFLDSASDEFDSKAAWQALHQKHEIALRVCVTAAARRGLNHSNLAANFSICGISEYFAAVQAAEYTSTLKCIQF